MSIETRSVVYQHEGTVLEGHLAWESQQTEPRPTVLVAHAWGGRDPFAHQKAEALAALGYVGFALDMYGQNQRGSNREECQALMQPLMADRSLLQARMQAGLAAARQQAEVEAQKVAVIGYCFGGLCALDLARSGADVLGAVSFHGLLQAPGNTAPEIPAKILILHGYDDPMATPEALLGIHNELSQAGADWQSHCFGGVMHAFTNPIANDPDFGTVYNATANQRSWKLLLNFLEEIFA